MAKPILIGQAAAKNGAPRALFPADPNSAGGRLMRMARMQMPDFLEEFESFNTIDWFPGRDEWGDRFEMREGILEAHRHTDERKLYTRVCIFVGKANATCYDWGRHGMPQSQFVWREFPTAGGAWAWIYHTSGKVKSWERKYNRDRIPRLMYEALCKAGASDSVVARMSKVVI